MLYLGKYQEQTFVFARRHFLSVFHKKSSKNVDTIFVIDGTIVGDVNVEYDGPTSPTFCFNCRPCDEKPLIKRNKKKRLNDCGDETRRPTLKGFKKTDFNDASSINVSRSTVLGTSMIKF